MRSTHIMRSTLLRRVSALALLAAASQTSCVVVGGYDSERGWFVWPGSLVIMAVVVVALLLLRRRRR